MEQSRMKDVSNQFSEHLECPICFEIYKFPKLLPCQHTFCEHCLRGIIMDEVSTHTIQGVHKLSFSCPVCRQETLPPHIDHSPDEWASLFPTNLLAASLIESMPSLKEREDKYPKLQHSSRSLSAINSSADTLRTVKPELPSREYGHPEGLSCLEGIPSPFDESIDFESIVSIVKCVKQGCLELKHTEEENLEKLEVLKSMRHLTSEDDCKLESLRSEMMTRFSELNFLEDAICTTEMFMDTYFLEGEEKLEVSSKGMVIRSQLAEYENQLCRLSKRSKEVPVNQILETFKTILSKSSGEDKNVDQETEQAQCASFMPITEKIPAQQINGTWMPCFSTMNQVPALMFYPNHAAFPQPSAPYSSFYPGACEISNAEAVNPNSTGVKIIKKKSKWRKLFE